MVHLTGCVHEVRGLDAGPAPLTPARHLSCIEWGIKSMGGRHFFIGKLVWMKARKLATWAKIALADFPFKRGRKNGFLVAGDENSGLL